ncbi:metallophosphoesterase [Noviherbaspirillum sp. UKPF54]|uniref:metallophosphoesterase family protein n=1 Tax=Noviherbaspirillum sp. UKPF54 TaxID=2601898 RepID=UPI0011B17630|nr:metallophosphoesterase [Noviherbaspirillum sp. UKPF54]QDZ28741.1 alkaline phosphatase [Noviherbaspirillum sp. UKPF54]
MPSNRAIRSTGTFRNRSLALALAGAVICCLSGCFTDKGAQEQTALAVRLADKGVTVFAAGDVADCSNAPAQRSGAAKTAALIAQGLGKDKNAAVLMLGDATYPVGLQAEFTNCYEPTWGRFKQQTYPAPGNHEYYTPQATGYYGYFGDAAGPARRGYYSVDIGSWHVISLNSNLKPAAQQAQLEWLKNDLEQHKTLCTLAYWHHPVFSSGGHGSSERMLDAWKMLVAADADLVLVGHDHDYERFAPQDGDGNRDDRRGIRQFVVGTGGAHLTPFRFRKSNSEVSNNFTFGVLKLSLKELGYEWEFVPTADDGFRDRGAALCH